MKVQIDATRCQGHARCFGLAPEIFDLDDQGHGFVKVDEVPAGQEDAAHQAVLNCPEQAITVVEG